MKKILFLIEDLRFGGVEGSLVNLINSIDFDKHDCSVTVLMWGERYDMLDGFVENDRISIKIVKSKFIDTCFSLLSKVMGKSKADRRKNQLIRWLVLNKVKAQRADVVIRYHHAAMKNLFNMLNDSSKKIMWYHISKYGYYLDDQYTANCDKVIVVNDNCKKIISEGNPALRDKLVVIENIVPYRIIREKAHEPIETFDSEIFTIVSCARLSEEKGIDIAIEASRILKDRGMAFRWILIGDAIEETEEYAHDMKQKVDENGLSGIFDMIGSRKNPYPFFSQCDLYVQASREEAMPLTISEAQVCGAAVISTNTVGGRKWIENARTGYITDITPESLADKIYELYENQEKICEIRKNVHNIDFEKNNADIMEKFYTLIEDNV